MSAAKRKPAVSNAVSAPIVTAKSVQKGAAKTKIDIINAPSDSKQSRIVAMLRAPRGATLAGMMEATGWQKHSVRGFLAGVVRKRLKLKLSSEKVDDDRIYRIAGSSTAKSRRRSSKTRSR
jgi:hypothetical protein